MSEKGEDKRAISNERARELRSRIDDYLAARPHIPLGLNLWPAIEKRQQQMIDYFGITRQQWMDWRWQISHRVTKVSVLQDLLGLSDQEAADIELVGSQYRWAVSPYYLSLIEPGNSEDPVRRQAIPDIREYRDREGRLDPMDEERTSPTPAITRRYPDRLIINVTNQCAMFCRHCQRRRNIGEKDLATPRRDLESALDYIRRHPEMRDILLTGGDALVLKNEVLDWLLTELDNIAHVEIKRLGTRALVTMPYRIDDELCAILARHMPVYINTHFNHPQEITPPARDACFKLARAGVALGNQAVLLKGVNNDPFVMRLLNQQLLRCMVRPYYIFHAKDVQGTAHLRTRVEEGIEIMEKLRGYTSGLAIPTFIVNAPGGYGKTPMLPEYLISLGADKLTIRTWENRVIDYDNKCSD